MYNLSVKEISSVNGRGIWEICQIPVQAAIIVGSFFAVNKFRKQRGVAGLYFDYTWEAVKAAYSCNPYQDGIRFILTKVSKKAFSATPKAILKPPVIAWLRGVLHIAQ